MITALLFLAAMGGARAEAPAGEMCDVYYFGIGQPPDYARAFACEMAEPPERRNWVLLAVMHLNGEGTARDLGRARDALRHKRPDYCGATCAALDEVLRRQEAEPSKRHPRVDYCKDIAITTPDANYCMGVEARKEELQRKRAGKALAAGLAPEARKRFAALAQAFTRFKKADGLREYQNFREGTIRDEAGEIMEKRVAKHYQAALAAWGPGATAIGVVKNGEQPIGNKTRVKVVKNKVAPPFRECEFEILYGSGVSAAGEIVDLASEAGLIEKSGAYYSWNGERIAQGRDKACQYITEHPELAEELRAKLVALRKAENALLGAPAPANVGASEAA